MHKTKNSEILANIDFTKISEKNNAADRNRTGTGITTHGILSPGRLPVPPLRHSSKCSRILNDPEETRTLDLRRDRAAL